MTSCALSIILIEEFKITEEKKRYMDLVLWICRAGLTFHSDRADEKLGTPSTLCEGYVSNLPYSRTLPKPIRHGEPENIVKLVEYYKFTVESYFTVRCSDKCWYGIWTNVAIQQTLMENMKSNGGVLLGRGFTDSILNRLICGFLVGQVRQWKICATHMLNCEVEQLKLMNELNKFVLWLNSTLH